MLAADVSPEAIETNGDEHSPEPVAALHSDGIPREIPGDINGDGSLTSLDALTLLNSVNDPEAFPTTPAMDLDANNQVDLHDYELVVAALEVQNLMAPLNLHATTPESEQTMQGDWGGSTLLTSGCDADEVLLSTLNATRAALVDQLSGATLPSQTYALNEQISAIEWSIAQVEARLDNCDADGSDGSGDDGGSTDGTSDDPYGVSVLSAHVDGVVSLVSFFPISGETPWFACPILNALINGAADSGGLRSPTPPSPSSVVRNIARSFPFTNGDASSKRIGMRPLVAQLSLSN